tara:strand:- start:215 stop:370 length:156 start_codon:yes stop_codon:yes gene_type:complete
MIELMDLYHPSQDVEVEQGDQVDVEVLAVLEGQEEYVELLALPQTLLSLPE